MEQLNSASMATVEFIWKGVSNKRHSLAVFSVLNEPWLLSPRLAQNLTPMVTFSPVREVTAKGNDIILKVTNIPIDYKVQAENFADDLGKYIKHKLYMTARLNKRRYPAGPPKVWNFTTKITTRFTELENRLPELKGMFESAELQPKYVVQSTYSK
jgi:hypothetical protein